MVLARADAHRRLAALWKESADGFRRLDPNDRAALALERCAAELLKVDGDTEPEWVSIQAVQDYTGLSRPTLLRRAKELERRKEAKKIRGSWVFALSVVVTWPQRGKGDATEGVTDLMEFARIAGSED